MNDDRLRKGLTHVARRLQAIESDESSSLHSHRCMRCNEEFTCKTPEICNAQYDVMPTIVTLDEHGRAKLTEHCPEKAPDVR